MHEELQRYTYLYENTQQISTLLQNHEDRVLCGISKAFNDYYNSKITQFIVVKITFVQDDFYRYLLNFEEDQINSQ